jgi:predicted lipoprotein with Yx(FWY)xxD motif
MRPKVRLHPVVTLWMTGRDLNEERAWAVVHRVGATPTDERTTAVMTQVPGTTPRTGAPDRSASGRRAGLRVLAAVAGVSAVLIVTSVSAASAAGSTVGVATTTNFGTVLTNAAGFALYTLPSDQNGMSSCSGSCASVWPALTVPAGTMPTAGSGVTGTVAAVMQADGTDQVTYNGSPLYTFVGDTAAGEATGNGVGGFAIVKVTAPTAPTATTSPAAPAPTATSTPASPSAPTSTPAASTPASSPVTPSPAAASTSSGGGTSAGSPAPATSPAVSSPSALAFTGPGPALVWMLMVGAGLIAVSLSMLVVLGGRRRLAGALSKARARWWLLDR